MQLCTVLIIMTFDVGNTLILLQLVAEMGQVFLEDFLYWCHAAYVLSISYSFVSVLVIIS